MYIRGHDISYEMSVCLKPLPVETPVSCDCRVAAMHKLFSKEC